MGKESLHLRRHSDVGTIVVRELGNVLCGCGGALVFVDLEARHHLVHNIVGVVKAEFINCTSCFSEFKASLAEVMFDVVPCFVCLVCALPRSDIIFEYSLLV